MKTKNIFQLITIIGILLSIHFRVNSQWDIKSGNLGTYMYSVYFISSNDGWAVGEKGAIYHYDGNIWAKVSLPFIFETNLYSVFFTSSTHGWIGGGNGILLEYKNGEWKIWDMSQKMYSVSDIFFISENDGWIAGSGNILLHYDGINWIPDTIMNIDAVTSIHFVNSNLGWATTYKWNSFDQSYNGKIYKYNGSDWKLDSSSYYKKNNLNKIFMLDATHGWAVGENGYSLKYNGIEWIKDSITNSYLYDIYFTDAEHGWALSNNGFYRYDSAMWKHDTYLYSQSITFVSNSDGWAVGNGFSHYDGTKWNEYRMGNNSAYLLDAEMISENKAWIVGRNGTILKYDNNNLIDYSIKPFYYDFIEVNFTDSSSGIAIANNGFTYLYKEGQWKIRNQEYLNGYLNSAFFFDTTKGWAVGYKWDSSYRNIIAKYFNGNWTIEKEYSDIKLNSIFFLDENNGWAVGNNGIILNYHNGEWTKQVSNTDKNLTSIAFTDINNGWAAGDEGLLLKYSNGIWQKYDLNTQYYFYSLKFSNSKNGWLTSYSGIVFKFDGNTWTKLATETSSSLLNSDFYDDNTGMLVGNNGTILYTKTGGIDTTHYSSVSILGNISNRTTFNADTIKIFGNITWNNNLIIPAGTVIEFQGPYYFNVYGKLTAIGTPTDSIKFNIKDTTGYSNTGNSDGSWQYLNVNYKGDTSKIEYCKFEYSKYYNTLNISTGLCKITHCDFTNSKGGISLYNVTGGLVSENKINSKISYAINIENTKNIIIEKNDIQSNSDQYGIGINNSSDIKILKNTIHNNTIGIYSRGSVFTLLKNKICNNEYEGLYITDSKANIINNLICNNGYYDMVGGIYSENSILNITNSTIANNRGYWSGGIYFKFSNGNIINTILWNNLANRNNDTAQVFIYNNGSKPNFYNCNIQGGVNDFITQSPEIIYSGIYKDNIDTLPQFNNPSTNQGYEYDGLSADWSLKNTSPCINMSIFDYSSLSLPETDLAENDRVMNGLPDIGAYEKRISPFDANCDTIKVNTIWAADTIRIKTCNIIVHKNATLKILPGTIIEFWGPYKISVFGSLKAIGTENDPIRFSYYDTTGYWQSDSIGWRGIELDNSNGEMDNSDSSSFKYCIFEFAKAKYSPSDYYAKEGNIRITNFEKVTFSNCEFRYNTVIPYYEWDQSPSIINLKRANADIYKCNFHNNRAPVIYIYLGKAKFEKSSIYYNHVSPLAGKYKPKYNNLFTLETSNIILKNNLIANNSANYGNIFQVNSSESLFDNNLIVNNGADSSTWSGVVYGYGGNIKLINNTFANNSLLGVYTYYSLTQMYNNIIWGNKYSYSMYAYNLNEGSVIKNNNIQQYWYTDAEKLNNISDTPRFVMPSAGSGPAFDGITADWRLTQFSPCINQGIINIPGYSISALDYYGNTRIKGLSVDIGAAEHDGKQASITLQPNNIIACLGSKAEFKIEVDDSVQYQWYKDKLPIQGQNSAILTLKNITLNDEGNYSCKVSNAYGEVESNNVYLIVKIPPSFKEEPKDVIVGINLEATLNSYGTGTEPLTYQWFKDNSALYGETSTILKLSNIKQTDEANYYCKVTNMCGEITSKQAKIIIAPQICMVTFDSTANHNLVTWERNSKYVFDHYNIYREGTVSGYYIKIGEVPYTALTVFEDTLVNPKSQAFLYKITATDLQGKETPLEACAYHKTIHLLVTKGVPTGYQLDWDEYIGFPYGTYKIYRSINGQPFEMVHEHSATTRTWTDFNAPDGYLQYFIAVEKSTPCVPYNPYKSSAGPFAQAMSNMEDNRLKTSNAISLTKQPENKTVCIGQAINLNVEATGDNLQYEWYKNGTKISGAATNKLEFTAVTTNDEANYYCIVKNNDTQVQSNNASIIVKYPPEVNVLSDKTEINKGANGSIAVIAYGSMPMTYQWYKNTNIISNATSSVLSFSSFAANDTGNYICKVKNSCAEISSQTIKVKLSETNTIDYFTKEEFDLQVYPNPFKNITTIKYSTEKPVKTKIQIVNIVGITIEEFSEEYNISGLRSFEIGNNLLPGMYYVKLIANEQEIIKTIKLLKY
jgi:photosystem II stability/assembly factor-like uncharacterized protein